MCYGKRKIRVCKRKNTGAASVANLLRGGKKMCIRDRELFVWLETSYESMKSSRRGLSQTR